MIGWPAHLTGCPAVVCEHDNGCAGNGQFQLFTMYRNNKWDDACIFPSCVPGQALQPLQLLNGGRIKVTSVSHPHSSTFGSLFAPCQNFWQELSKKKKRGVLILKCEHGEYCSNHQVIRLLLPACSEWALCDAWLYVATASSAQDLSTSVLHLWALCFTWAVSQSQKREDSFDHISWR